MEITHLTTASEVKVGDKVKEAGTYNSEYGYYSEFIITEKRETKARFIFTIEYSYIKPNLEVFPQKRIEIIGKNSLFLNKKCFKR